MNIKFILVFLVTFMALICSPVWAMSISLVSEITKNVITDTPLESKMSLKIDIDRDKINEGPGNSIKTFFSGNDFNIEGAGNDGDVDWFAGLNFELQTGFSDKLLISGFYTHVTAPHPEDGEAENNTVIFGNLGGLGPEIRPLEYSALDLFTISGLPINILSKEDLHEGGVHKDRFLIKMTANVTKTSGGAGPDVFTFNSLVFDFEATHPHPVPEPNSLILMVLGFAGISLSQRKNPKEIRNG